MADQSQLLTLLAANVRRLRTERGYSLMDLVRRCTEVGRPVHKNTILNLENETLESVRSDTIEGLAAGLGVPYLELLMPFEPPKGGVSLDDFLHSEWAASVTPEEVEALRREVRATLVPPTMMVWVKSLELVRARREASQR